MERVYMSHNNYMYGCMYTYMYIHVRTYNYFLL